jgi:gluconate kinase
MEASSMDLAAANRPASGSKVRRGTPLRDQDQWRWSILSKTESHLYGPPASAVVRCSDLDQGSMD